MSSTAAPFSAHTIPQPHPLTSTTLEIRLEPSHGDANRPFAPGSVLFGEVALVVFNERGVRDVKHRISVSAVTLKIFWESRSYGEAPEKEEYHRGGSVVVPLASAVEDVLFMPNAFGRDCLEASWSFEVTLPEKSALEESRNGTAKGKASSSQPLVYGPPPSFSSTSRSIEHILEASVVVNDPSDPAARPTEILDARGFKRSSDMEIVERIVFPFQPDGDNLLLPAAAFAPVHSTLNIANGSGETLATIAVQVTPVALPIPVGGSLPLSFNFRLIPTPSSSEEVKTYALDADSSWMIQNVVGRLDIECSGSKKDQLVALEPLKLSVSNSALSSPSGFTAEVHLDFFNNSSETVGSIALPNLNRTFALSFDVQCLPAPFNQKMQVLGIRESWLLPFVSAPYERADGFDPDQPPPMDDEGHAPPSMDGGPPPPGFDAYEGSHAMSTLPPSFARAMGEGGSGTSGAAFQGPPPPAGDAPPGY